MRLKKIVITIISSIMCLSSVGCSGDSGSANSDVKNQIVYASTKDIRDINPHLYSGEMAAQNMVFESLVRNTNDGVEPWLAKSWDISED